MRDPCLKANQMLAEPVIMARADVGFMANRSMAAALPGYNQRAASCELSCLTDPRATILKLSFFQLWRSPHAKQAQAGLLASDLTHQHQ